MDSRKDKIEAKGNLNRIIGRNIQNERNARNITREEFSKLLYLSPNHLGLIEQGQRGASVLTLQITSKYFQVSIDNLFSDENSSDSPEKSQKEKMDAMRKKIIELAVYLDEDQLEYIVNMIKANFPNSSPTPGH